MLHSAGSLQDHNGDSPVLGVRESHVRSHGAKCLRAPFRFSPKAEHGSVRLRSVNFNILPGDPFGPSGPKSFEDGFLSGEADGKVRSGVFARATKFLLGLSVNPSNETVPLSLQGRPYPGDLYDVHSDSHDHSGLSNSTEESPGAFRCSVNLL